MGEKFKKTVTVTKEFWEKQPKKSKIIYISVASAAILFAVIVTFMLNNQTNGYTLLYTGMDSAESILVYNELQEMAIPVQLNEKGEVMVETERVPKLLPELMSKGYPKTTTPYGVFSSNAGFTTTEFEKKQYLIFNLEEKIRSTLKAIDTVKDAEVILNIPQESNYVLDTNNESSSASILVTMAPNEVLEPEQVSAVKNLIAASVPKMTMDNVKIVDANTGLELKAVSEALDSTDANLKRLGFEEQIEQKLTEKAINVLSLGYGPENLRVSATVEIDYDKMITEQMEQVPDNNGQGVITKIEESYDMDPSKVTAGGVAGEEDNTDVPQYIDTDGDGVPEYVNHTKNIDFLVTYIKTQIEKDSAKLSNATMSVTVNDPELTQQKKEAIIETVSMATNIRPEKVSVQNFSFNIVEPPAIETGNGLLTVITSNPLILAIIAGIIVMLIVLVVVLMMMQSKKKKKQKLITAENAMINVDELAHTKEEMDEHKRKLREAAEASNTRENAITNEIRDFATANPEITASLLRAWLKEEE